MLQLLRLLFLRSEKKIQTPKIQILHVTPLNGQLLKKKTEFFYLQFSDLIFSLIITSITACTATPDIKTCMENVYE